MNYSAFYAIIVMNITFTVKKKTTTMKYEQLFRQKYF